MALNPLQRSDRWIDEEGKPTDRLAEVIENIISELNDMTTNAQLFSTTLSATDKVSVYDADASKDGSRGTIITKFTATGTTAYSVFIGTAAANVEVMTSQTATADGVAPVTLIDQLIKPGDSIFIQPATTTAIVFYASGTERR